MEDQSSESCESDGEGAELDPATLNFDWADHAADRHVVQREHLRAARLERSTSLDGPPATGVEWNVEQRRDLISCEGRFGLGAGASPDVGTTSGAVSVGGQSDLGQEHSVAIAPSSTYRSSRPMPSRRRREFPVAPPA